MIFTYTELKRMLQFSEQHDKQNVSLKTISCGIMEVKYIQTQDDLCKNKDNLVNITDYEKV